MPTPSDPHARLKALIVDDQEDTARTLELMLRSIGYDTEVANDGIDGLRKATSFQPDLMLLDISMPKLDGYDTCGVIRAQPWASMIRLVAVSGWDPQELKERSEAAGFDAFLLKPVEFAALEKVARPA